jgi:hypothetical protein
MEGAMQIRLTRCQHAIKYAANGVGQLSRPWLQIITKARIIVWAWSALLLPKRSALRVALGATHVKKAPKAKKPNAMSLGT